jgi:hypothetical protein
VGRANTAAEVAASSSMLRERDRTHKAEISQRTRSQICGAFKDGNAKDDARHEVVLPADFEGEAARNARVHQGQSSTFRCPLHQEVAAGRSCIA